MITIFVHLDSKEEISSNLNFGCGNPLDTLFREWCLWPSWQYDVLLRVDNTS